MKRGGNTSMSVWMPETGPASRPVLVRDLKGRCLRRRRRDRGLDDGLSARLRRALGRRHR
jgi:hypothetical protein